jgi:FkbM family methyltransferase
MYDKIRNFILGTLRDVPYLIKSTYPKRIKLQLLLTYLRLSFKFIFYPGISDIRQEKMFGFTVSFFDYDSFLLQYREMFIHNQYYFRSLADRPFIVDCGANIGLSVIFFKWLYPACSLYAFEPDIRSFKILNENIRQNHLTEVKTINIALSDKTGMTDLYIDSDRPGNMAVSLIYGRLPKDSVRVQMKPLSGFIKKKRVDFLKMDIEGMEETVLRELIRSKTLANINESIIEYHKGIDRHRSKLSSFLRLIESQGYSYRIDAPAVPVYWPQPFQDMLIYIQRLR